MWLWRASRGHQQPVAGCDGLKVESLVELLKSLCCCVDSSVRFILAEAGVVFSLVYARCFGTSQVWLLLAHGVSHRGLGIELL
jgi:hypothetical protein